MVQQLCHFFNSMFSLQGEGKKTIEKLIKNILDHYIIITETYLQ